MTCDGVGDDLVAANRCHWTSDPDIKVDKMLVWRELMVTNLEVEL